MATNNKKSKNSSKDSDKKSSRKAEESVTFDENKEDVSIDNSEHVLTPDLESNIHESQNEIPVEVEPVYEEPVLTLLIVERYVVCSDWCVPRKTRETCQLILIIKEY